MQRVFRVVETRDLKPAGARVTSAFIRSVRRYGVINPTLLAEVVDADGVISLEIIDGNRRVRAAQSARLPKVPAVVLKATTKQDRARLTLLCNYMRSANFHTESSAILALAADEEGAAEAAGTIGLGRVKMQQLYRKIATMPEPVRQAMYEHRIPVTAATWVGAWPEGLQRELIELLGRRRIVNTTMMKDLREWYAERHPEEFGIIEQPDEEVPFDEWSSTDLRVVGIPAPEISPEVALSGGDEGAAPMAGVGVPVLAASREPVFVPGAEVAVPVSRDPEVNNAPAAADGAESNRLLADRPAEMMAHADHSRGHAPANPAPSDRSAQAPPASRIAATLQPTAVMPRPAVVTPLPRIGAPPVVDGASRVSNSAPDALSDVATPPRTADDDRPERMVAFVVRLDATLRDLAAEGHALGIDRSVWVDRTMRAWDLTGR